MLSDNKENEIAGVVGGAVASVAAVCSMIKFNDNLFTLYLLLSAFSNSQVMIVLPGEWEALNQLCSNSI